MQNGEMAAIIWAASKTSLCPPGCLTLGGLVFWKKLALVRSEWRHRLGHILAQVFTTRPKVENADAALSMKTTKSEEKWQDDCACRLVPQFGASANGARLREMALGKSGNTGGIIRRQLQLQASAHRVCLVSLGRQTAIAICNLQLAIASNVPQPAATSNINCVFFWLWLWATSGFEFESRTLSFPRAFFSNRNSKDRATVECFVLVFVCVALSRARPFVYLFFVAVLCGAWALSQRPKEQPSQRAAFAGLLLKLKTEIRFQSCSIRWTSQKRASYQFQQ